MALSPFVLSTRRSLLTVLTAVVSLGLFATSCLPSGTKRGTSISGSQGFAVDEPSVSNTQECGMVRVIAEEGATLWSVVEIDGAVTCSSTVSALGSEKAEKGSVLENWPGDIKHVRVRQYPDKQKRNEFFDACIEKDKIECADVESGPIAGSDQSTDGTGTPQGGTAHGPSSVGHSSAPPTSPRPPSRPQPAPVRPASVERCYEGSPPPLSLLCPSGHVLTQVVNWAIFHKPDYWPAAQSGGQTRAGYLERGFVCARPAPKKTAAGYSMLPVYVWEKPSRTPWWMECKFVLGSCRARLGCR